MTSTLAPAAAASRAALVPAMPAPMTRTSTSSDHCVTVGSGTGVGAVMRSRSGSGGGGRTGRAHGGQDSFADQAQALPGGLRGEPAAQRVARHDADLAAAAPLNEVVRRQDGV